MPGPNVHNSAMRTEKHWSNGPPPPPPAEAAKDKTQPLGGWGTDLRERFTGAVLVAVIINGLMLVASTGFLRNRPISDTGVVNADTLWAAMLLGSAPIIWGIQQVKLGRDDNGFRTRGLPSLLLVSTVLAAVFQVLLMLTWPLVADESVPRQGALAQYHNDPIAFGLVAVFVIALYAWTTVASLGFIGKWLPTSAIGSVGWMIIAGAGIWQAFVIFENTATVGSFWVWAGIALLGLVLIPVIAAVRVHDRRPQNMFL